MFDTVECPYCKHDNDMSDSLTDLPSDNRFDQECTNCGKEFEVEVEFHPSYSASKIEHVTCERCEQDTRDIYKKGKVFPYPENIKENNICKACFHDAMREEFTTK